MKRLLFAFLGLVTLATAQGQQARDIVREQTSPRGDAAEGLAARTGWRTIRGLRWQLLVQGADGEFRPARPDGVFATDTAFRLELEADNDLYVYCLNRTPKGREVVLLPEEGEDHLLVARGRKVTIPQEGQFRFLDPPGTEGFRLIASPEKLTWVNPRELFDRDAGRPLDRRGADLARVQEGRRDKSLAEAERAQARRAVSRKPLDEILARPAASGAKDTMLRPPPEEAAAGGAPTPTEVIQASTDRGNLDPIIIDLKLTHRRK